MLCFTQRTKSPILLLLLLCVVPAFAQDKAPEELLKNPGFEEVVEGNIVQWPGTDFAITSSTERVDSGKRSLKISSDKAGFDPIAMQEVRGIEQGKTYKLEYRVRAAKFNEQYRVYVGVWKKTDNPEVNQWLRGIDEGWRAGWDNWQKVSVEFTLNDPADFLLVVIQGKGPSNLWFDDVSLKLSDHQKVAEKDLKPLEPFVGSPKFVQIMPDRTFRVQGKPFFPVILWGWHPNTEEGMAKAQDYGFNVITTPHIDALGADGFKLWLDKAQKYGLLVKPTAYFGFSDEQAQKLLQLKLTAMKRAVEVGRNHPAMFGYTVADEPAWGGNNMEAYAAGAHLLRDTDPNHPILVNHAPRNTIADLARYNRFADISGSDIYPVWKTGIDIHSDLPNKTIGVVGDETTKNLQAVDNAKPIIQTLQGFAWSDNSLDPAVKDEPFPSQDQLRFMAYHTIVRGATGVAFFQDGRYQTVKPELKPIAREINSMSDVLAAGKTLDSKAVTTSAGIELLAKELNGELVLIALNSSTKAVDARLDLSSILRANPALLAVLQENRKVSLAGKVVIDSFAPFAVHIYTTNERKVLRPFVVAKVKAASTKAVAKAPKRENLALKAVANGSSVYPSYSYAAINDGDPEISWNDATQYTYPDWATLEFPQPVTIDQIVVYSHKNIFFDSYVTDGVRDYELQVEKNGEWETVANVKDSTAFREVVNLKSPVTTKKLRIWITATNGDQDWTRLGEIEVYGKS